jgi:hypothetical protein
MKEIVRLAAKVEPPQYTRMPITTLRTGYLIRSARLPVKLQLAPRNQQNRHAAAFSESS